MKRIIVFAKAPKPGQVKTRLHSHLRPEEASLVMKALLKAVLGGLQCPMVKDGCDAIVLACSPTTEDPFLVEMANVFHCERVLQGEGNLGERMQRLCQKFLCKKEDQVILLGADAPTLDPMFIVDAFDHLKKMPIVLGPSLDGGYYLLGLSGEVALAKPKEKLKIFKGIDWGSSWVLGQTLENLRLEGFNPHLLPFWYDVDRFEDLGFLRLHLPYLCEKDDFKGDARVLKKLIEDLQKIDKLL